MTPPRDLLPSPDTTAPSSPDTPRKRILRARHRRSSTSPTSSPPPHATGIGRKVAESLQLFKQSEERPLPGETALAKRRFTTSHPNDGVEEARYEFVKRADWPDPETAALRRERSSTGLENVRSRDYFDSQSKRDPISLPSCPLTRDPPSSELLHWRKDVPWSDSINRGRCRRRASDVLDPQPTSPKPSPITVPQSPCIRPCSRLYPPSPSPSRSPTDRIPPLQLYNPPTDTPNLIHEPHFPQMTAKLADFSPAYPLAPTPTHILPHASPPLTMPPSPSRSVSPWSTDDESAWETQSMVSDISTTSGTSEHSLSFSHMQDSPIDSMDDREKPRASLPNVSEDDPGSYGSSLWNADSLNMVYGDSEESLPHIPLRPFRNQVGGHSAIYKFTKRAVCKPLVSRENQFYEAVEREAPPLLAFIPRYLGVMLVTYRRVLKGAATPSTPQPPTSFPFPVSYFSGSVVQRAISEPDHSLHDAPLERISLGSQDTTSGMKVEEAELLEVALDRNRHIIPKWLLHRSHPPGSRQRLRSTQLSGAAASSPALIQNQNVARPSSDRQALSRQSTLPLDEDDPYYDAKMASSFADPRSAWRSDNSQASRPDLRPFRSDIAIGSQHPSPSWFGGTGSTTVNTKLKDHIFSTILRRFHRRGQPRWLNTLPREYEQPAPSHGQPKSPSLQPRLKSRKPYSDAIERLGEQENERCTSPLRRVRSDGEMGHDGQNGSLDMDYDKRDDFSVGRERSNLVLDSKTGMQPLLTRPRSRSRSVDSSPLYLSPASPSNQPYTPGKSFNSVPRQHHFILMEDLTGRLKQSCVLDLKMGTRQYGMDAVSGKKRSQRKKCDRTTSRPLGVRVCGMQVWNHATQSYITQNKYMGRDIRAEEFPSLLASFLHDGERLLVWHIPVLLQKLYALARIISRLKGFRFYGCSLLLIYDGDRDAQEAFRASALEHPSSRGQRSESLERSQTRSRSQVAARSSLRRTHSEDLLFGSICRRSGGKRKRGEVNVRIVDFAHTTTGRDWAPCPPPGGRAIVHQVSSSKGYEADVDANTGIIYARFPPHYPEEPDRGFLFGLKNLSETLEKIWNDERIRRIRLSRDDPAVDASQLPPLVLDGREIFDEIFGPYEFDEDPGMLST